MPQQKVALFPPEMNPDELDADELFAVICQKLHLDQDQIGSLSIDRTSFDARWDRMQWRVAVSVWSLDEELPESSSGEGGEELLDGGGSPQDGDLRQGHKVVVVGSGPAGMFCALDLLKAGISVTLLERGKSVQDRRKDIAQLNRGSETDPESNYCFGEGGAGTYSDGKLYTRSGDKEGIRTVLQELVANGAPENILWSWRPHIGSNLLPKVVQSICQKVQDHPSGEVRFGARVEAILTQTPENSSGEGSNGPPSVTGVKLADGSTLDADAVVLATGHSALDSVVMARHAGAKLEAKGFAMGVRVEHPQAWLDKHQYHDHEAISKLPPSFYELATQINERGVYSFCMCPGGWIVPSQTEPGALVVNGMSLSKRDSEFANSGIVVEIKPKDWCGKRGWRWGWPVLLQRAAEISDHAMLHEIVTDPRSERTIDVASGRLPVHPDIDPLFGVRLQIALEVLAAHEAGGENKAPSQICENFISDEEHQDHSVPTSYLPGLTSVDFRGLLPKGMAVRLREGLMEFQRQIPGFGGPMGQMIGVETRTSSPVRLLRNPHHGENPLQSPTLFGLYPCGEGAGYAGGIVSAALDGKRIAQGIVSGAGAELSK
jgi:uncharacterized FAD-dependent dehydrogenase